MNTRQHAYLARALQDACGGADACLNLLEETPFKMGRTHIYDCRDPSTGRTMPIGAVTYLETHLGRRIYTPVVCQQVAGPTDVECAVSEACAATEAMSIAQRLVRVHGPDGYSETEKREIEPHLQMVEAHVRGVRSAMDAEQAS